MIHPDQYLYRTHLPKRMVWCDEAAELRQANAIEERRKAGHGAPEDPVEALHINKIGLYGEAANMLHLSPVMSWPYYKKGSLHRLADFDGWIDSKTNKRKYQTNYLIIAPNDPSDWAYILTYPMPSTNFMRLCSVGWCSGKAAKQTTPWKLNPERPAAHNIPHDSPILRPMKELILLHRLRLEFGMEDGLQRWLKMKAHRD